MRKDLPKITLTWGSYSACKGPLLLESLRDFCRRNKVLNTCSSTWWVDKLTLVNSLFRTSVFFDGGSTSILQNGVSCFFPRKYETVSSAPVRQISKQKGTHAGQIHSNSRDGSAGFKFGFFARYHHIWCIFFEKWRFLTNEKKQLNEI